MRWLLHTGVLALAGASWGLGCGGAAFESTGGSDSTGSGGSGGAGATSATDGAGTSTASGNGSGGVTSGSDGTSSGSNGTTSGSDGTASDGTSSDTTGTSSGGSGGSVTSTSSGGSGAGGSGGGTSSSTEQYARDYDQSCQLDYECGLVTEGDACGCGSCENAAINTGDLEKYQADWAAIQCPPVMDPLPCVGGCAEQMAVCSAGTCAAITPVTIEAGQFDGTCREDEDCHLIYTGRVCNACMCSTAAVNAGGYQQYLEIMENIQCNPGPSDCDCAAATVVSCLRDENAELGTCEVGF